MKKFLLTALALVTVAVVSIVGTVAYLTWEDSDVNVMTVGNVQIDQFEMERDENGKLVPFTPDKAAYPAVYQNGTTAWEDEYQKWEEAGAPGSNELFDDSMKNVIDKFVFVKNTGTRDAYYRTYIAIECPDGLSDDAIHVNFNANDRFTRTDLGLVEHEGVQYHVFEMLYNEILKPGEVSRPSLLQVYLDPTVTNEDCALFGETWEIIALSQAVQAAGFEGANQAFARAAINDADVALDTAFGEPLAECSVEQYVWNINAWLDGAETRYEATQKDTWDGTADASWYDENATEFVITTAEQLAGLADLVDGGNTFEGKTVKLGKDVDLASLPFNPIGHSSNGKSFNGTFDGQGYTISNMYEQSNLDSNNGGWLYEGEYYGLFAYTNGATIKNVTIADAYISSGRNEAAGVVGNAVDTAFSDITISNTTLIAYNNSAGGVAAECYGDCSFTNIVVDEDTVIGPLWGTYDVRLGGIVGMVKSSDKVSFSNVTVSCKLDAINDVAANYQYWLYRYSGMLIGQVDGVAGVADPTGYVTCENVTVNYGDWVNYHYCEFESLGAGSYNGPGEYKYARVEAGTGTDGIDLSACNHNADESHNVLIVFDQLFGGGQGVSGLKTYDGVTVNYNK